MKKIITMSGALLLCLVLLVSCAANKLESRQGGLYDPKTQIYYTYAPMNVEALSYSPDVYITDKHDYTYHAVYDMNKNPCPTSDLLYDGDSHTLIYNSDMKFPEIYDFEANQAVFYIPTDNGQALTTVDDIADTAKIVAVFKNPAMAYKANAAVETYRLRFFSEKYPYFAFVYTYIEYSKDQLVDVTLDSLDGYTFIEDVPHTETQNADGSWTVSYNYGKYFVYDRNIGLCYMAEYIHDAYNTVES